MEPAIATAAAYGVETAIEGGVAGYYLSKSTLPLKGHLQHVTTTDTLPRSGHTISVISDRAYIFGGFGTSEFESPNNDIHELHISTDENTTAVLRSIPAVGDGGDKETDLVPSARHAHSAAVARNRIFIFGGSEFPTGKSKPVEENGRLWVFDPLSSKWSFLDPPPDTTFPFARKDHVSTSSPDGSAIFIHGGLSSDQVCLNDLWVFYLDEGKWTRLPDAPGIPRHQPSITCGEGKLWRFGGSDESVDEKPTLHQTIDFIEYPAGGTLEDVSEDLAQGRMNSLKSDCEWETWNYTSSNSTETPSPRHSAALHFITTGNGRDYLLLALGCDDREVFSDIWVYQLPSAQYSSAKLKDVIRDKLPGVESHRGEWSRLQINGIEVGADEEKGGAWTGRRRFGSSMTGTKQFMIWGGLGPRDETLGDGWRVIIE
ncbi:hypothetical protein MFRU_060g00130 [Monilinia fructicola]|uniref:Uncharacterized protein n=1 Tax=Monilinia fructicola TaxID=38448 RepID=A0A5M9JSI0_MONFR|nr:hypothetical protein EYC84_002119 [Monilinia fructicola]KAG4025337.1 hypothetical protein MFRU_060g00130 [Monilinia fructicola]